MSWSPVLEVAIGIVFVFLLVSLICSQIGNVISGILRWRSKELEDGIRNFILNGDQALTTKLYNHPLIQTIAPKDAFATRLARRVPVVKEWVHPGEQPPWIPSRTFVLALFDTFVPGANGATKVDDLRAAIGGLPDTFPLKTPLLALVTSGDEKIDAARHNIETWFDAAMAQVTAIYARNMWRLAVIVGIIVSVLLNVDTVAVATGLWRDSALRSTVVATATQYAQTPGESAQAAAELEKLKLPIGWAVAPANTGLGWSIVPNDWAQSPENANYLFKAIGWLVTGLAGAQGAPFWFDVLKKLTQRG